MAIGSRNDPYMNYNFLVEIDGITAAGFQECSGLESSTETVEYREGGENSTSRKLPGRTTFGDIVLKRGITDSEELWDWRKSVINGSIQRKSGSIILLDQERNEARRWNFHSAWPSKWEGPSLDAKANDVAIETLTITHESLEIA